MNRSGGPQQVVDTLARTMRYESAVAWVHAAHLVQHATGLGLIPTPATVEAGVETIASAHPRLEPLFDPAVNQMWNAPLAAGQRELIDPRRAAAPDDDRDYLLGYQLGDLYQTLSVEARKRRALCQTPAFVTELLLDLAADPAHREFGVDVRLIDPACGTGHILVEMLIRHWSAIGDPWHREMEHALPAVHGVDLDGYAAAVAAYRLLAITCRADGRRLSLCDGRDWPVHVACANALLDETEPVLERGRYHAVVANPPYITVKDKTINQAIRARYPEVCHGKYSLALPFHQLFHELLAPGGWTAQLTANSFMKREFGKKYIEGYLTRFDLQWVIDTSGAYLPGHGTPTVILVDRNQPPSGPTVRTIQGVKGEPRRPADPERGLVWTAIATAVRERAAFDQFVASQKPKPVRSTRRPVETVAAPTLQQPTLFDLIPESEAS